ncbi:lipase secretion chaperone [Psychrobacter sp. DAB_AL32B]|uniref:lipase secretion chaperone n=1 Tax=Psychrobacter sp. DAB_AL32B TaxID=1028414 RepID=UPI000B7D5073|nr:lipase secretion chaperone [Psychrobacter sp. DAB_AL32B]OXL18546.1 lipase chaperone [Psychrobacter sp. DAB_AL32B]
MNNKRHTQTIIIIALLLLAVLTGVIWWLKPKSASIPVNDADTSSTTLSNSLTNTTDTANDKITNSDNLSRFTTGLEQLPNSLKGTDVDGGIIIDENRQLVVTEGLRRLFDYFLSAMGEEDEATIIARVEAYIRSHTPEPAASSAIQIFQQYVNYLKGLDDLQANYGSLQMQTTQAGKLDLNLIAQRRQDVNRLRQQLFDQPTIEAFFGGEDAYEDYSVAMLSIEQDTGLDEAQKKARREDYISRLPDGDIKQNFQQQANFGELTQRTEEMKAKGASAEELFAMRRGLVGEAAASRLAEVDTREADFDNRFNQYQAKRQALINSAGNEAGARAQIEQLERSQFNEDERKRLTGYAELQEIEKIKSNK